MTSELLNEAMDCDAQIRAAKTPAEMKAAISRRRLVRAEMDFVRSIDAIDAAMPLSSGGESFTIVR